MRTVKVYSSKQGKTEEYVTDVTTWGDLRSIISADYDLSNLKAVENINKTTLEHVDAVLPEGDFVLFLRQDKTKSGIDVSGMGFKALRNTVKSLGTDCIKYLNSLKAGKNYTQLSTEDLRDGLEKYISKNSTDTSDISSAAVASDDKEEEKSTIDKLKKLRKKFVKIMEESEYEGYYEDDVEEVKEALDYLISEIEDYEEDEKEVNDNDSLSKELRDLEIGFL